MFNREFVKFYENQINKLSSKIINFYQDVISYQRKEDLEKAILAAELAELKAIYTVYGKAYDPRAGSFLTVYLPSLEVSEKVEELIKKHFGAFSYRTKQDCKVSSYRCYNKHAIDLIIEETEWYKLSLNLIFNDNPYDDMKKYDKFSKKAPQGIKY